MNAIVSNKNQGLLSSLDIDVIKSINGEFTSEEIIQTFSNFFFNRMFLDITAIKDFRDVTNIQKLSMNLDVNKIIFLLDNQIMADNVFLSKLISMGIYNFANSKESLMYLYNHPNSYKDVAHIHQLSSPVSNSNPVSVVNDAKKNIFKDGNAPVQNTMPVKNSIVIGFKNATVGAGASTLIYMIKKYLSKKNYVVAIEVGKNDFGFFNEKDMYSVSAPNLKAAIDRFNVASHILVDLNSEQTDLCDMIIYLIEPSIIKLNKMMLINKNIFDKISGEKVILNKSLLGSNDISDFEFESHIQVTANVPPLNDRADNSDIISQLLEKLGIKN